MTITQIKNFPEIHCKIMLQLLNTSTDNDQANHHNKFDIQMVDITILDIPKQDMT